MEAILDERSLEILYRKLEKPLFNMVYRWLWNKEEAQDIVQETFLRLWSMREKVYLETIKPLVYKIALNLASNKRRFRKIWKWISLDALSPREEQYSSYEHQYMVNQVKENVKTVVDSLPEKIRRVIMLCEFSDMNYEEVAQTLGIPVGTVASRRNKAIKYLESRLGSFAHSWEE